MTQSTDETIKNARVDSEPQRETRQQRRTPTSKPPGKSPTPDKLTKSLSGLYGNIGMMLYPFDQQCATAILENADEMAKSLSELAKENTAVKRVLEKVVESGAFGSVLAAHAPLLLAVAGHHGPQVARLFSRPAPTNEESAESDTEPLSGLERNVPPHYQHPGDGAA